MPVGRAADQCVVAARERSRNVVDRLAAVRDSGTPISLISDEVSTTFEEFSTTLLHDLVSAVQPDSTEDAGWLKRNYVAVLAEFAAAVRDLIPDATTRHSLAQQIQCSILLHELKLREILSGTVARPVTP